jgi:hypothetical protein
VQLRLAVEQELRISPISCDWLSYNSGVSPRREKSALSHRARHIESLGVVIVVLIILISLLVRFARHAAWSWR